MEDKKVVKQVEAPNLGVTPKKVGRPPKKEKKVYKTIVTGFSFGVDKVFYSGDEIDPSKFSKEQIDQWLKAGYIQ